MLLFLSLVASASAAILADSWATESPQGPGPRPTWTKDCHFNDVGAEGCDLTVRMTLSPNSPCSPGCPEFCVRLIVDCPAGIPAGDPGEHCESSTLCEICCSSTQEITLVCDGQTFNASPAGSWGEVAKDCSNLKVTVS